MAQSGFWFQRSPMFIDTAMNPKLLAPEERDGSSGIFIAANIALRWSAGRGESKLGL